MVDRILRRGETVFVDADGVHVPVQVLRSKRGKVTLRFGGPRFVRVESDREYRRRCRRQYARRKVPAKG